MKRKSLVVAAFLLGSISLGIQSCTKDPCENVVCQNGGVSEADGEDCLCDCEIGYEGDRCELEVRAKYMGNYLASGSDNQGGSYTNWTVILSNSSSAVNKFLINLQNGGITLTATLNAEGTGYTIEPSTVGGYSFTGSGSLTSTSMTLTLNETEIATSNLVIYNFNGIKQ